MVAWIHDAGAEPETAAFRQSLEQWRVLGAAVPDVLLLVSRTGRILYANHAPAPFRLDEIVGSSVFDLVFVEARKELRASLADTFETGAARMRELPARHPDGTTRWY